MFGYLQIQKSELLVREYEAYKAVYCALCKQMGKDYSILSRLSLSYDCTFYAMLMLSIKRSCKGFKDGRCTFNPLKKCKYAFCDDDCYSKAAAFSIISAYYKLKDNLTDENIIKKLATYLILPFFSHWRKKAKKKYEKIEEYVATMMKMQNEVEHDENATIDSAAHPTAFMISNIFALETEDEISKSVYSEFGYHLGRWIYYMDAADDLQKDIKRGNYNPFVKIDSENLNDYITAVLNQSLARAYAAYNLIEIKDFKGILDNMMLLGFPATQNRILKNITEDNNE